MPKSRWNRLWLALMFAFPYSGIAQELQISPSQALAIGKKIWNNEAGGKIEGLTDWNAGEEFASLGIGHFIWYPKNYTGPFEESFPKLIGFMEEQRVRTPRWLKKSTHCPWNSREEFYEAIKSDRMMQLRQFLADTVALQAQFEARRLEQSLPKMLEHAHPDQRDELRKQFYRVAGASKGTWDPQGLYTLMDYVNFKGEGTSPTEKYNGQGWGLLQVLENMHGSAPGQPALDEFANSAESVLAIRVKNSPPARNEAKWLPIWKRRIETYRSGTAHE